MRGKARGGFTTAWSPFLPERCMRWIVTWRLPMVSSANARLGRSCVFHFHRGIRQASRRVICVRVLCCCIPLREGAASRSRQPRSRRAADGWLRVGSCWWANGRDERFDAPKAAVDLLDRTSLLELIWVMRRASCVISVDSGPAHLAAALGRPMVAIHTWSDPRRVGPYRHDAWVWKNGQILTVGQLASQPEKFFGDPQAPLSSTDIVAIADLAISLSGSSA